MNAGYASGRELGISLYPDFLTDAELLCYLKRASDLGFTRVFSSLLLKNQRFHQAEDPLSARFAALFHKCREYNLKVTVDINDDVLAVLGCSPGDLSRLAGMGVRVVRVDGGYGPEELAEMTRNPHGIMVELNASDLCAPEGALPSGAAALDALLSLGRPERLTACFNFYPREDTGLRIGDMLPAIELLKSHSIPVSAFVASQISNSRLHPPSRGCCTVESHRDLPPAFAMEELFSAGVSCALIGDASALPSELEEMAAAADSEILRIPVVYHGCVSRDLRERLGAIIFQSREDQPDKVIRATASRGIRVPPVRCGERSRLCVTIDNERNFQYMGELQIALKDLGPSAGVNVLGFVHPDAQGLIDGIRFGRRRFSIYDYAFWHAE